MLHLELRSSEHKIINFLIDIYSPTSILCSERLFAYQRYYKGYDNEFCYIIYKTKIRYIKLPFIRMLCSNINIFSSGIIYFLPNTDINSITSASSA